MERQAKYLVRGLAALGLLAACTGGGSGTAPPVDDAWMDTAVVQVAMDAAARRETVTLVDEASGTSQQMNEEPLIDDVVEVEDSE